MYNYLLTFTNASKNHHQLHRQTVCVQLSASAVNVALPACAAEHHAGQQWLIPPACRVLSSKLAVKSKGSPYSITKCRFLAVSLQVTWVINPAVGCHYLPPGLQLPPQPLRGLLPILLLGEQRHNGCEQFAWQHCDCDLNPGPSAPESSTLTTRLPSHPEYVLQ